MSSELGISVTTSYDWSQTDENTYEQSTENSVSAEVAPGKIVRKHNREDCSLLIDFFLLR